MENRGINVNGIRISNLRFSDDVILLSNSEELNEMIAELAKQGEESGPILNINETKKLTNQEILIETHLKEELIKKTNEATYLGQQIKFTIHTNREIEPRIMKPWNKFSLRKICKGFFRYHHNTAKCLTCVVG